MSRNKKLGIPYMGGKRAISKQIVDFILSENPQCEYFYDLFGGGGAVSFEALQRPQIKTVLYNEINNSIVALIKKIRDDGVTDEFYKWISREEFFELIKGDCWRSGLAKTCWSFGNNYKKGYLFGSHIEEKKRLLHEVIVNRSYDAIYNFEQLTGINIDYDLLWQESINDRRLAVMKYVKSFGRFDLQRLQRLQQLERLERLEQLARLQQLERLERLELSNKSYDDVVINAPIDKTVIYLDPPYINTAKYSNDICHNKLYEYIEKSPYKIYLSSYESHLPCVFEIEKRSVLSATNNSKKVIEKLFVNR